MARNNRSDAGARNGNGAMNQVMPVLVAAVAALTFPTLPASAAPIAIVQFEEAHKGEAVSVRHRRHRHHHVHHRRYSHRLPQACAAVVFPRSPLCDPPYIFGPFPYVRFPCF